jgi:hypothetical protein
MTSLQVLVAIAEYSFVFRRDVWLEETQSSLVR